MSADERARGSRYKQERHRNLYIISRGLIRTVLSGYFGLAPRAWQFGTAPSGRPFLVGPTGRCSLLFNIAHTEGMIVCACTTSAEIGVDAECVQPECGSLEIAERYFSESELGQLLSLPEELQVDRFFQLWTLKEAYLKATGLGLNAPLDRVSFTFSSDAHVEMSLARWFRDRSSSWRLWLLRPSASHVVAICARRSREADQRLVVRKMVPLVGDEPLPFTMIARSVR